jgi:hypothetical protein
LFGYRFHFLSDWQPSISSALAAVAIEVGGHEDKTQSTNGVCFSLFKPPPFSPSPIMACVAAHLQSIAQIASKKSTAIVKPDHVSLMNIVPDEVLSQIFQTLSMHDLFSVAQVCRRWRSVSLDRSIWRQVAFSLAQTVTIPVREALAIDKELNGGNGNSADVSQRLKQRLTQTLRGRADVWYLRSENRSLRYLICWGIPSAQFVKTNARFGTGRFNHIRTLNLSHQGDRVTSFFLSDVLLPVMPNLASVDFSGCNMIGDAAIQSLVRKVT